MKETTLQPKFLVNETVLCKIGIIYQIGIIKEIVPIENYFSYRVWYHSGDTAALTAEDNLRKIENINYFTIIRHSVENNVEKSPARKLASEILGQIELYGNFYYKLEDWLTNFLEGRKFDLPRGIEGEYLRCALRVEIRDFFDSEEIEDIESSDIEECVDRIINHCSENVLNMDFIKDIVNEYIEEREEERNV